MKKLLFGFLFVIFGLVAAVLVVPSFVNWNEYRDTIAAEVNAATGFNMEIRGDIKIGILPSPALLINDVHVANIEGASKADTLSVKSFEVRVALAPLIGGQLQIQSVKLVEPDLSLEVLADGRTNMAFKAPPAGTVAPAPISPSPSQPFGGLAGGANDGSLAIQVDNFIIEKGAVTYRDEIKKQTETIKNLNGRFALASLSGPMESSGSAVIRGVPMSFTASTGEIVQGRTLPFNFNLKVIPGEANLQFAGALTRLNEDPQVKGKLLVEGQNLAEFISAVSNGGSLPESIARPFGVTANVAGAKTGGTISDLVVKLNGSQGTGSVTVELGDKTDIDLQLAVNKFDVDALLAPAKQDKPIKPATKEVKNSQSSVNSLPLPRAIGASSDQPPFSLKSLPKDMTATLNVSVAAITFKQSVIRQAKINAVLDDQEITISQASALLPGSTDVGLLGTVLEGDPNKNPGPAFEGNVDLSTNDLRGLLNWAGADVSAIATNRLRKFSFGGVVEANAKSATLKEIAVQLDNSKMNGAASLAFRARPSFGVNLEIDKLNLDGYLPAATTSLSKSKPEAKSSAPSPSPAATPTTQSANPLASLGGLAAFDANIDVNLKTLTFKEIPISGLRLSAQIFDGLLKINEFRTRNAAGLAINLTGNIDELKANSGAVDPAFDNFKLDVRGKSLARLISLAKLDLPLTATQIGPFAFTGTLSGKPKALTVTTNTSMLGGKFALSGLVEPLLTSPRADGKFSIVHPNLVSLVRRIGSSYRPAGKRSGGIDLRGTLKGDAQKLVFNALSGKALGVSMAGTAATDMTGPRPKVTANLKTSPIVIDDILPAKQTAFLNKTLREFDQAIKRRLNRNSNSSLLVPASFNSLPRVIDERPLVKHVATKTGAPWTKEPIDLTFLRDFDADLQLRSDALTFQKYRVSNVDVASLLTNGVLDISRLTGKAYGGNIKIDGRLIADAVRNQLQTRFDVAGIDTGSLLSSLGTKGFRKGALNLVGELRAVGKSSTDLVGALNGGGTMSVKGLDISSAAKSGSALSGFASLFLSLQQFGSSLSGGKTTSKQADFSTSFRIEKGVAKFDDMSLLSGLGNGAAKGVIDLPNWRIDTAGEIQMSQNIVAQFLLRNSSKQPLLPFNISGPLDDPNVKLETAALTKGGIRLPGSVGKKLDNLRRKPGVGAILDQIFPGASTSSGSNTGSANSSNSSNSATPPPQTPPSQQQEKPKVEDFLKGILQGLGR